MATAEAPSPVDRSVVLTGLATESLEAFKHIAHAASSALAQPAAGSNAFAVVNELTATKALSNLSRVQSELASAYRKLQEEPAIARVTVVDEHGQREVLYICRATPVQCSSVTLCSSLGPKGRLAALPVGDGIELRLPSGSKYIEVVDKAVFKPVFHSGDWDSKNTVFRSEEFGPLTIASLRELLAQVGVPEDVLDILERELAEEDEANNIVEGLRRTVITAMQLRDLPVLDKFQDDIFRLPLDSRLVILGPPGTGKTTTLVRRVRQKVDFEFLTEEEQALVSDAPAGVPSHPSSWLMFTPTELLKQYVREAFAREGVPAPEPRIRTWADHRRELARRSLPILRSASGGSLVLNEREESLLSSTIADQISWFDDFYSFQGSIFLQQVSADANTLEQSGDPVNARLGSRLAAAVFASPDKPVSVISATAALLDELRKSSKQLGSEIQRELTQHLAKQVASDPTFLADLATFVASLATDDDDEMDEAESENDGDEEEETATSQAGLKKAAKAAFIRALRAQSVAEARKRSVSGSGRNGQVLRWIAERGVALPSLSKIGQSATIQSALRRLSNSTSRFVRDIPRRYRAFRRERLAAGKWYVENSMASNEVSPLELDVILLSLLRNARNIMADATLMRRLGERAPQVLQDVSHLQRNQVLVDEATDFSPIQLACMAALTKPRTESFFACGDFNQRLTTWGTANSADLHWVLPGIQVREIDVAYRQSRRLNELATRLASGGEGVRTRLPEDLDNEGVPPVVGTSLSKLADLVDWLSQRIAEIEDFTGLLPSIAVLVNDQAMLHPLANHLNDALADRNIKAVACPDGQVMGQENDVRVFEVEHIKGLEFEAVFFIDVDELEKRQPALFDKYLYVGATRAATYLGVTCSTSELPSSLSKVAGLFGENW